jgi:hypothetical protein
MGIPGAWYYGIVDLGSAIETAEKVIAKVKTNKFDKDDLVELEKALTEIRNAITDEA